MKWPLLALIGLLAPLAGAGASRTFPQVDVSRAPGTQAEVSIVADPGHPTVLLAGSNSDPVSARVLMRVYTSTDGGNTWGSQPGPLPPGGSDGDCTFSDPAVGIDLHSREYYAYLYAPCDAIRELPNLAVATRIGARGAWRMVPVEHRNHFRIDDKPALAVDTSPQSRFVGRVYLIWIRSGSTREPGGVVVSHSQSQGRAWSRPVVVVGALGVDPWFPAMAVGARGQLYVAWMADVGTVEIARSTDGGAHFGRPQVVDRVISLPRRPCDHAPALSIPAQPQRCISPAPSISIDRTRGPRAGRVYAVYGKSGRDGREQDVFVHVYDARLRSQGTFRVNPPDGLRASDQFFPVSAIDQSNGLLWVCYYNSGTGRARTRATFSCTASADGGEHWSAPVRAASRASDTTVPGAPEFEYGDYEGLAVANGVAHPIWTDTRDMRTRGEEIYTTAIPQSALQLP